MHSQNDLFGKLRELAEQYPTDMVKDQITEIPRIAFNIDTTLGSVKNKSPNEIELCDLGGGVGLLEPM